MYFCCIVDLDLPGTRIDQSIGTCYDHDACSMSCSPQEKIDSSELMQGGRPLGLLYLVMVVLRVSYGYGYTRWLCRVAIFQGGVFYP